MNHEPQSAQPQNGSPDTNDACGLTTERALQNQFEGAFGQASYPLESPFELIPILPDGPETIFEANGIQIPAIDLGLVHGRHLNFPYRSEDELVKDTMEALRADGVL